MVQNTLYGGTSNFIREEFPKLKIEFTFTDGYSVADFKAAIQPNTKLIHIETPSNPLLTITDIKAIADLANEKAIVTSIDNTFASPINQNPADFGIDLIMHSATKYFGGHSDICAGAVAGSKEHMDRIWNVSKNLGGSLSDFTVWMLERSMKTMGLRVKKQTKNAGKIAKWLEKNKTIKKVNYPGLKSHPEHKLAKSQMHGYGAMLSFELANGIDSEKFQKALKLIKASMSLAGIESTVLSPAKTSHSLLSQEDRDKIGISDGLIRFSVGIESIKDLKEDIQQALNKQ